MDEVREKEYPIPSTSTKMKSSPTGSSDSVDSIGTRPVVVTVISVSGQASVILENSLTVTILYNSLINGPL